MTPPRLESDTEDEDWQESELETDEEPLGEIDWDGEREFSLDVVDFADSASTCLEKFRVGDWQQGLGASKRLVPLLRQAADQAKMAQLLHSMGMAHKHDPQCFQAVIMPSEKHAAAFLQQLEQTSVPSHAFTVVLTVAAADKAIAASADREACVWLFEPSKDSLQPLAQLAAAVTSVHILVGEAFGCSWDRACLAGEDVSEQAELLCGLLADKELTRLRQCSGGVTDELLDEPLLATASEIQMAQATMQQLNLTEDELFFHIFKYWRELPESSRTVDRLWSQDTSLILLLHRMCALALHFQQNRAGLPEHRIAVLKETNMQPFNADLLKIVSQYRSFRDWLQRLRSQKSAVLLRGAEALIEYSQERGGPQHLPRQAPLKPLTRGADVAAPSAEAPIKRFPDERLYRFLRYLREQYAAGRLHPSVAARMEGYYGPDWHAVLTREQASEAANLVHKQRAANRVLEFFASNERLPACLGKEVVRSSTDARAEHRVYDSLSRLRRAYAREELPDLIVQQLAPLGEWWLDWEQKQQAWARQVVAFYAAHGRLPRRHTAEAASQRLKVKQLEAQLQSSTAKPAKERSLQQGAASGEAEMTHELLQQARNTLAEYDCAQRLYEYQHRWRRGTRTRAGPYDSVNAVLDQGVGDAWRPKTQEEKLLDKAKLFNQWRQETGGRRPKPGEPWYTWLLQRCVDVLKLPSDQQLPRWVQELDSGCGGTSWRLNTQLAKNIRRYYELLQLTCAWADAHSSPEYIGPSAKAALPQQNGKFKSADGGKQLYKRRCNFAIALNASEMVKKKRHPAMLKCMEEVARGFDEKFGAGTWMPKAENRGGVKVDGKVAVAYRCGKCKQPGHNAAGCKAKSVRRSDENAVSRKRQRTKG